MKAPPTVYLVGAGPGDPGLITVRGRELLDAAEVVIADRLVAKELLADLAEGVELIVRGEHRHGLDQDEINRLLVDKARAGKRVVRLKGGDPFVFGRGGEEAEYLREQGVSFQVVPGVTAAIAAPAYAGIPVTHRGIAGAVAFVTGHETDEKNAGHVDWEALSRGAPTIVLYMSISRLPDVVRRLLDAGRPPSTPVAIIERGTTPRQRTVVATLADILDVARDAAIQAPALTIVGEVVRLRDEISWFESRPLRGRRVLCLRTERPERIDIDLAGDPADGGHDPYRAVAEEIADLGGALSIEECFVMRMSPAAITDLDEALARRGRFGWLALTSAHAAHALHARLGAHGLDTRALSSLRIAALPQVAAALRARLNLVADATADDGEGLARAILASPPPHGPVLFLRGRAGRTELADTLREAGVTVEIVETYDVAPDPRDLDRIVAEHRRRPYDAIAVGSPHVADAFLAAGGSFADTLLGALGETTAAHLRDLGLDPPLVASRPSFPALLRELAHALATRPKIG